MGAGTYTQEHDSDDTVAQGCIVYTRGKVQRRAHLHINPMQDDGVHALQGTRGTVEHDGWMQPLLQAASSLIHLAQLTTNDAWHACSYYMCLGSCVYVYMRGLSLCADRPKATMHLHFACGRFVITSVTVVYVYILVINIILYIYVSSLGIEEKEREKRA